jgi:hypothetical protein
MATIAWPRASPLRTATSPLHGLLGRLLGGEASPFVVATLGGVPGELEIASRLGIGCLR